MQNPPPAPPGYPYQQAPMQQYVIPPQVQTTYAGFWIRFVARFVDGLIVGIPLTIVLFVLVAIGGVIGSNTSDQNAQNAAAGVLGGAFVLFYIVALLGIAGYQIYFWGTSGQTIAMRLFHLRVVDATTGAPIGIGRAIVRWLMTLVNSWACYIGWIWVAFDARKQGWHDKVASSVVLQTP
ncbi:MAG TPA: RDD family protein [Candidatus Dormibacteraeota bacterium]|nr:RDD family protein [Candidatus Dormibacteraeota bacterium]